MKKIVSGLVVTFLLFTFAISSFAVQSDQAADKKTETPAKKKAPRTSTNFVGTITAGSATSITVKTTKGDKTAAIDDKTKIKHEADGKDATAADLKEGERAHIWAKKTRQGIGPQPQFVWENSRPKRRLQPRRPTRRRKMASK